MNDVDIEDSELVTRLRRLDASVASADPQIHYEGLIARHAQRQARARRRAVIARGAAGVLAIVMIGVSAWHLDRTLEATSPAVAAGNRDAPLPVPPEQRLVRADTWLALAVIEDHIASIDDALSDARLIAPHGAEVARLERTRAELLDSHAHVRYADMVAANF